jgi:PAS domain-containing protein
LTTIIAQKKQISADRRKIVNGHGVGLIGVRDETKLAVTPYCIYGCSGFEFSDDQAETAKLNHQQRLATIFALHYFLEDRFRQTEFYRFAILDLDAFFKFRKRLERLRGMLGQALSEAINARDQQMIAVGIETTFVFYNGAFHVYNNDEPAIIGAGRKQAAILLDHGLPLSDVYESLRDSGIPTGYEFETLGIDQLDASLFPPVLDNDFLLELFSNVDEVLQVDLKLNLIEEKDRAESLKRLTETIATFLSLGEYRDGLIHFNKASICFDFSTPESRQTQWFDTACEITGFRLSTEEQVKEEAQRG